MSTTFDLIEPTTDSEFAGYYDLRWRELRAPWNQPRGSERDNLESVARHVAAIDTSGSVIGVGRLHFNDALNAQIRYMATAASHCGHGVGSAIIHRLETIAAGDGARLILINARINAVPFYAKNGYEIIGDGDLLFDTIAHKRMHKLLPDSLREQTQ